MRIDEGVGRRTDLRDAVVVGDQDVDPAARSPASTSVTLDEPVSTVMITAWPAAAAVSTARLERPWPSSSRLGHIGLGGEAEPAQGADHDRQAGQAVGIEVAEDEDAATVACAGA